MSGSSDGTSQARRVAELQKWCPGREALPPRLRLPAGAPAPAIMAAALALVLVVAVTVRAALFRSSLAEFISERVEVVSPLSSWKRGEATGSSRRSNTVCALLASVNERLGSGRKLRILTGVLRGRGAGPKDAAAEGEGSWDSGDIWPLRAGLPEGCYGRGCVPLASRARGMV